jgi:hypothetical protein
MTLLNAKQIDLLPSVFAALKNANTEQIYLHFLLAEFTGQLAAAPMTRHDKDREFKAFTAEWERRWNEAASPAGILQNEESQ